MANANRWVMWVISALLCSCGGIEVVERTPRVATTSVVVQATVEASVTSQATAEPATATVDPTAEPLTASVSEPTVEPATATAPVIAAVPTVTAAPTATVVPTATSTATANQDESLAAQNLPPPGVPQVVTFTGEDDLGCQALPDPSEGLQIMLYRSEFDVGSRMRFCFSGFATDAPLDISIEYPDGRVNQRTIPANEPFGPETATWVVPLDTPIGVYSASATQNDQSTSTQFAVVAPREPRIIITRPFDGGETSVGTTGTVFDVILSGFPAQTALTPYIYRSGTNDTFCPDTLCGTYVKALPPIQTNERGEATTGFGTRADDPTGTYIISAQPSAPETGWGSFVLEGSQIFSVGDQAATQPVRDPSNYSNLWTEPVGGARVQERPKLYGGALVTVLELLPNAVRVRAEEGVEGWIHEPASSALIATTSPLGERANFVPGGRAAVTWANGIPLRAEPRSTSAKLIDSMPPDQQFTVEELRGDWLRVTLDDGTTGWARWYYDGVFYIVSEV
jgi:hypothetical protein